MRLMYAMRLQRWKELNAMPGMEECFKTIPEKSQRVLIMHFEQGIPIKDIAAQMKCAVSTARHYHDYGLFLLLKKLVPESRGFLLPGRSL